MPVNTPHSDYVKYLSKWQRGRDCTEGSDAIKAAGTKYMIPLDSHLKSEAGRRRFKEYCERALFYNAMGRTVDGLSGVMFQKEPDIEVPPLAEGHDDDVTLDGVSLEQFGLRATKEIWQTGRYGILIEMGDEEAADQRPYWCGYEAEKILNWRSERINGYDVLMHVVLEEQTPEVDPKDEFVEKCVTQWRVLQLINDVYTQSVWRKEKNNDTYYMISQTTPTKREQPLTFIPFVFIGPTTMSPKVEKPPLDDLAIVNISHYRGSADLKHGLHFTALPTPWVAGAVGGDKDEDEELTIGGGTAWQLDVNGKAGMLEFSGAGLGSIREDLQDMQKQMATLGARMLEEQASTPETMGAVSMRHAGEHANVRTVGQTMGEALTWAFQIHCWWMGETEEPEDSKAKVALNKDYFAIKATPQMVQTALATYQAEAISFKTFYHILTTGEWYRDGVDAEEEKEEIAKEAEEYREQRLADIEAGVVPDPAAIGAVDPNAPPAPGQPPASKEKKVEPPKPPAK